MASSRRDKGDGSIRKRPNGSWEGRYKYKNDLGQEITKSVYAPTQTEVKRKLKDLIKGIETAEQEDGIKPNDLLLGEWLNIWLKDYKKNSVSPATYASYHQNIEQHIRPALGNAELQKIKPHHIQKVLNEMGQATPERKALAPWTVIKVKNILSGAFEQAIRNQILLVNSIRATVSPKMEQKEIHILTDYEQKEFLNACKGHRLEALYTLALATGMRRGEILALSWDNVNLNTKSIMVKSSVSRIKDPDTQKTDLIFSEPKTKAGRRSVPIVDSLIPVLESHKERQDSEKATAGSAWNERNLVFCSNVGSIIEPRRVCTTMDKIADKAGLEHFTFHALRHTFATRMLEANVPAKVVQDILGHADVTLTLNTYSHVIGTTAHEQIAKINDLFATAEEKPPKPSIQNRIAKSKEQGNKKEAIEKTQPSQKKKRDEPEL
ncbi:MAG: site-specific integrase [Oscillospiraceae bacterium]|nr:site-specific integrase [Oscillospiraceae bacterium]